MRAALLSTAALAALSLTVAGALAQSSAQGGSSGTRPSTSAPSAGGSAASTGDAGGTSGTGGSSSQAGTGGSAAGTSGTSPSGPSGSSGTGGSSSVVGTGGSAAGTAGQSAVTPPGASPATTGALSADALTTQQRVELRRSFTILNTPPARNLPVPVTAGTVIPDGVDLHEVPADAAKAAPSLNGQRFFVIRNDVVIVDPATRKIVTILAGNS